MTDSTLNRFLAYGTNTQRLAFTPSVPTPASGPSPVYLWYETDTGNTYAYASGAWAQVNSGLASIADGDLIANISGSSAAPVANTLSAILDHVLGSAQGDILYRGASNWTVLAPGTSGNVLTTGGASANPSWTAKSTGANPTATASDTAVNGSASTFMRSDAAPAVQKGSSSQFGIVKVDGTTITSSGGVISAAGSSGGLWSSILSSPPTAASTGLSNLVGTGAASSDTSAGLLFTGTSGPNGAYTTSVPATPYSFTVLLATNTAGMPAIGWTDGTKYQFMYSNHGTTFATYGQINVQNNSNLSTFASSAVLYGANYGPRLIWLKIADDGTNVTYSVSTDGVNFPIVYTVAKASGYLGSSGYSHVFVGNVQGSGANDSIVMSWAQGS